jgi:HK97 family phage major capsid protein
MGRKDDPRPEFVKGGEMNEELKVGARNNKPDKAGHAQIRAHANAIVAISQDMAPEVTTEAPPETPPAEDTGDSQQKSMEDTFVNFGSEVKALGDGKVGGYLVRFSGETDPDLMDEFFNKDTDFAMEFPGKSDVYFNHGLDGNLKHRVLSKAELKTDEFGVWAETLLNERDEFILDLAKKGKLGWSSGTAGHLVEREAVGKATWIKRWPLGLDASLTHIPAEPRNSVVPLKSIAADNLKSDDPQVGIEAGEAIPAEKRAEVEGEVEKIAVPIPPEKEFEMDEELKKEISALVVESVKAAMPVAVEEAKPQGAELVAPAVKKITDLGFANEEMKSFMHWVKTGDDVPLKTAMIGQTDANGGYYVPDDFWLQIVAKRGERSIVDRIGCPRFPVQNDRVLVPIEGTAATKFVVVAEAASYDENEPTAGQAALTIYKLTKLIKLSEEIEVDAPSFQNYLADAFARAVALAENYYFVNGGTGTSMPQAMAAGGSLGKSFASATAITAAEMLNLIYAMPAAYSDHMALLMKRSTLGYIRALSGNPFSFLPTPIATPASNNMGYDVHGDEGTVAGLPVFCTDAMGAMTTGLKSVLCVNPEFYGVAERSGLRVRRNEDLYMATGQIGLFADIREGGAVLQSEAILWGIQA